MVIGLLIGGMLPFAFSAMTMDSVSKAAYKMIEEVRRQFREIPGILEGTGKPDYTSCVGISTTAALHEMIVPGLMAVIVPLLVGILLSSRKATTAARAPPPTRRPSSATPSAIPSKIPPARP